MKQPSQDDPVKAIRDMWRIFAIGENSVVELRALWPLGIKPSQSTESKLFHASKYSNLNLFRDAVELEALRLNAIGYNVYTSLNSIKDGFSEGSVHDADIRYRDLLLIDIDRTGTKKQPANADELEAARLLAAEVKSYCSKLDFPDPITVMSGNGYHLYYVLAKLENNDSNTMLVEEILQGLAAEFDNSVVSIDTVVYNAGRITKVPGTLMRKGEATEDRPYRMAVICND